MTTTTTTTSDAQSRPPLDRHDLDLVVAGQLLVVAELLAALAASLRDQFGRTRLTWEDDLLSEVIRSEVQGALLEGDTAAEVVGQAPRPFATLARRAVALGRRIETDICSSASARQIASRVVLLARGLLAGADHSKPVRETMAEDERVWGRLLLRPLGQMMVVREGT